MSNYDGKIVIVEPSKVNGARIGFGLPHVQTLLRLVLDFIGAFAGLTGSLVRCPLRLMASLLSRLLGRVPSVFGRVFSRVPGILHVLLGTLCILRGCEIGRASCRERV